MTYLVVQCFLVNFINYKSSNFCSHSLLNALAAINAACTASCHNVGHFGFCSCGNPRSAAMVLVDGIWTASVLAWDIFGNYAGPIRINFSSKHVWHLLIFACVCFVLQNTLKVASLHASVCRWIVEGRNWLWRTELVFFFFFLILTKSWNMRNR